MSDKTMLFNPYNGKPRHPADIASDPSGLLMVDPDLPLRAASQQSAQAAEIDFYAIIREFGYTTSGQTLEIVEALDAAITSQKEKE